MTNWRELFGRLRFDPCFHVGGGDVRITMAMQDDICDQLDALAARLAEAELDLKVTEEQNTRFAALLTKAELLIDEVDTLAVNNTTGCGTCSTIQNLTTAYLTRTDSAEVLPHE